MQEKWIFSSTFLPYTGEPIEFLLEDRSQPIHGTFADGVFHSRWADYDADRIASWRETAPDETVPEEADPGPSIAPIELSAAPTGTFIAVLKRLTKVFSRGRAAASAPPRSHARTTQVPAFPMSPNISVARHIHSNQISS